MAKRNKGLKLRQTIVFGANFLIYLVLFLLFLGLFGISSIKKYLDKKTIIVTSEEQTNGIMAPAVTLSATKQSILGWKTLNQSSIGFQHFDLFDHCNSINMTDIETCVLNDTFNKSDFLYI